MFDVNTVKVMVNMETKTNSWHDNRLSDIKKNIENSLVGKDVKYSNTKYWLYDYFSTLDPDFLLREL